MRFGNWRALTLALGLACAVAFLAVGSAPARAQDFHAIPRLVPAVDVNTGGPYYAPPIPYGHYAGKNISGKLSGKFHGLLAGHGHGGMNACGACGGKGCGLCGGSGFLGHGSGGACNDPGCGSCAGIGGGHGLGGLFKTCGLCKGAGCGGCSNGIIASAQGPIPVASPQVSCGKSGCGLFGKHGHMGGCGSCGGNGCGNCAVGSGNPCGGCGGKGCGLCGGLGLLGGPCKFCGGAGCKMCGGGLGHFNHLLGRDKIKWFVGPGGPIPLTPGYTPYVNVTRSPRDYFAFPPFSDR
jgi:hypothetical protein